MYLYLDLLRDKYETLYLFTLRCKVHYLLRYFKLIIQILRDKYETLSLFILSYSIQLPRIYFKLIIQKIVSE
jgi:hypothetical protein